MLCHCHLLALLLLAPCLLLTAADEEPPEEVIVNIEERASKLVVPEPAEVEAKPLPVPDEDHLCADRVEKKVLMGSTEEVLTDMTQADCELECAGTEYCRSAVYYPDLRECWINSQSRLDNPSLFVDEWWDTIVYLGDCHLPSTPGAVVTTTPAVGGSTKFDRLERLEAKFGDMRSPDDQIRRCRDMLNSAKCIRFRKMNLCRFDYVKVRCVGTCEACDYRFMARRQTFS